MESTSTPDQGRQSRGLSRFWPVHGAPAPEQRQSDDAGTPESENGTESPAGGPFAAADAGPVAGSGPTDEHPQVDTVQPSLRAGETQMVALGSRRLPEIVNGRPPGQGGFPPPETERKARAAEPGPRHGGPPIPTVLPLPPSRLPFGTGPENDASSPFGSGSPFGPASPFRPQPSRGSSGDGGARDARGGTSPRHDDGRRDSAVEPDRIGDDRRRRDTQRSRAAQDWATLPTSGIPTLAGRSAVDEAAADAPAAGSPADTSRSSIENAADARSRPFSGIGGDSSDGGSRTLDGNAGDTGTAAGRRSRDDEPRIVAPRRSTTLDDAEEPRVRAGRRAAPETADEVDGRGDRRPGDEADGDDAAPDASTPNADSTGEDVAPADHPGGTPTAGGHEDEAETNPSRNDAAQANADDTSGAHGSPGDSTHADADRDTTALANAEPDGTAAAGADKDSIAVGHSSGGGDDVARGSAADKSDTPLRPGDVEETLIAFWDDKAIERFRGEWHEVKADFVDDPVAALTRAHDLITEAVDDLSEALLAERDQLDPLRTTSTPDTESMRMAMRGYREFLDRILAL